MFILPFIQNNIVKTASTLILLSSIMPCFSSTPFFDHTVICYNIIIRNLKLCLEVTGMYHIVIIDDEAKIREGISSIFPWNNIGFEVSGTFGNGKDALDYIDSHQVDVVLTDIRMPVMDGIELSSILQTKAIKVVYFSSFQDFHYAQSALRNQVVDYLVKPIKYDELVKCFERVRTILDNENGLATSSSEDDLSNNTASYYERIIATVTAYLAKEYKDASLEAASNLVSLSPSYLSRIFVAKTGIHFSECLTKIRMEKAIELLNDIHVKQYEIAYQVGYDNPKNFSRAFRAYYGISPQEFRNNPSSLRTDNSAPS
jgi:YesN/AraC family two-component response regulator